MNPKRNMKCPPEKASHLSACFRLVAYTQWMEITWLMWTPFIFFNYINFFYLLCFSHALFLEFFALSFYSSVSSLPFHTCLFIFFLSHLDS